MIFDPADDVCGPNNGQEHVRLERHDFDETSEQFQSLAPLRADGIIPAVRMSPRRRGSHPLQRRGTSGIAKFAAPVSHAVNALLKDHLAGAFLAITMIVALPVSRSAATLAPIFLHHLVVDMDLGAGRLIEPREIAAQHDEVGPRGRR